MHQNLSGMKKKLSILFVMLAVMVTTAYADNVISASDLSISKSGSADMAINLTNTDAIRGIQFTLTLPDGVSVQGSDAGITYDIIDDGGKQTYNYKPAKGVKVSTTNRTSGWAVVGNKIDDNDNTYKFVLISLSGLEISTSTSPGAVMKVSFQAAKGVTAGEYQVDITDIHLSVSGSSSDTAQDDTTAKLTITDFVKGDVNGNGEVDIDDAVCILRHLVSKPNETFNEAAADVNGNSEIDIDDAVTILKFLVGKIDALSRSFYIEGDDDDDDAYDPD